MKLNYSKIIFELVKNIEKINNIDEIHAEIVQILIYLTNLVGEKLENAEKL